MTTYTGSARSGLGLRSRSPVCVGVGASTLVCSAHSRRCAYPEVPELVTSVRPRLGDFARELHLFLVLNLRERHVRYVEHPVVLHRRS